MSDSPAAAIGAPAAAAETGSPQRWLFAVTILTGSFLLFLVQPLVARMALPRLGGAPNVWNSAMLVYQALLLGGYAYAHLLSRLPVARQALIHLALLVAAAFTLPIALPDIAAPAAGSEAWWVPYLFLLTIGPLFFVVSAQAPLMQGWFAAHRQAGDPYPLYAASNLGSFAGLLAYPLIAEPLLPIGAQSGAWAAGYGVLVLLVIAAAMARRGAAAPRPSAEVGLADEAPSAMRIALWLALAAVPSGLMLSTTTHLTTDIFAMPLLWVIPLGLYLLSFSIAFAENRTLANALTAAAPLVLATGGALAMLPSAGTGMIAVAASLAMLFVVSVALHARLYEARPAPARLTQFYLVMSAGGVLGGLFTALIAPLVFDWTWEHPLLILAAAALLPLGAFAGQLGRIFRSPDALRMAVILLLFVVFVGSLAFHTQRIASPKWSALDIAAFLLLIVATTLLAAKRWSYIAACLALVAALGALTQAQLTLKQARSRSYFGIYTVSDTPSGEQRQLQHGTTLHGVQLRAPGRETMATSYYGAKAGVGLTLGAADRLFGPAARVGVVGLGVGTLACYRKPGQRWTFFEIDPAVLAYSQARQFTFLERCAPEAPVVIGDARLKLEAMDPDSFDILVIDAFSSDAIPLHLLTEEAAQIYFRTLSENGLLLIHISNRFIKLEPVLAALARDEGLAAAIRSDRPEARHLSASDWVVLSRDPAKLAALTAGGGWRPLAKPAPSVWRDDYASILPQIMWSNFL